MLKSRQWTACLLLIIPGTVQAQSREPSGQISVADGDPKSEVIPPPKPLSWRGVTLYGVVDQAVAWQSHGTRLNSDHPPGLEYVIAKNSGRSRFTLAPNALSQSKIGLKGHEPVNDDLAFIFLGETHFLPTSGHLSSGLKSLVHNNGKAAAQQSSNGDSSKDGQVFNGQGYFGLSSKAYGTLTFGRQWSLLLDNIVAYDPFASSYAFSIIGYQGAAQAGASTEDARLDRSLKYTFKTGHARLIGMYQFGDEQAPTTRAYSVDVGYDLGRLSVDGTYSHVNDSVSASSLTADQFKVLPHNSLAASISDNNAFAFWAKYTAPRWKLYAAVERIEYENPHHPITPGYHTIGGFLLSTVNNQAYPHHRLQTYSWAGFRYSATRHLDLLAAYYRVDQNSYGITACRDASASTCSGHLNALSGMADYRFTGRVDVYSGAMYSEVAHGMASGFLHRSTVDPMVGVRFTF